MPNLWYQRYSADDLAWQVTTASGILYKQTADFHQACEHLVDDDCQPDTYERFVMWKRWSGRRCIKWARMKLRQQRQRESEQHGPPIPPFEEF